MNDDPNGPPAVEPVPLHPYELLGTLRKHGADFIVIGGFSLAVHGYVRATKDIDIVPEPSRENLERLMSALKAHHERR